jgi:ATP-dependent exoDNAse (exonuclease V) alpha subunit
VAIYRLEAKVIGRTSGHSACAAAAYRAAERIVDQRTGQVHDYARRGGVEHAEILAPETAPAWVQDRAALWNAVETAETRRNAQLARELVLTLPRELTPEQRLEAVRSFVSAELVSRGMVADLAIHSGRTARDGAEQPHAHVMLTLRAIGPEGLAGNKVRAWNEVAALDVKRHPDLRDTATPTFTKAWSQADLSARTARVCARSDQP